MSYPTTECITCKGSGKVSHFTCKTCGGCGWYATRLAERREAWAANERRIDAEWDEEASVRRAIAIRVMSRDEPGILAKITNTISAAGINIGSAKVATNETAGKAAELTFELWVENVNTLTGLMREIRKVKGVRSVERVRG